MATEHQTIVSGALVFLFSNKNQEQVIPDSSSKISVDLVVLTAACASVCRDDRQKIPDYVESVVPGYLPDHFRRLFRMSRETFENILHYLNDVPELVRRAPAGGRSQISNEKDLLMLLWFIGSQETIKPVSDRFNVQESTLVNHNRRLLDVFCNHLSNKFIKWPTENEKPGIIDAFEEKKGFPGVLGAIDGTHISIKAPGENEADYINRKGFHSVILQAICKNDRAFTDIYCGWPGRVHDARVYRNSPFVTRQVTLSGPNHIIGDGAYPLSRCLMKPYRQINLTNAEKKFNKALSGTRSIIENTFGILKGRFRRLQYVNMQNIDYIVKTIVTACILHNICILHQDELEECLVYEDVDVGQVDVHVPAQDAQGTIKRVLITRQLANR